MKHWSYLVRELIKGLALSSEFSYKRSYKAAQFGTLPGSSTDMSGACYAAMFLPEPAQVFVSGLGAPYLPTPPKRDC